jgi:hypothetical protein
MILREFAVLFPSRGSYANSTLDRTTRKQRRQSMNVYRIVLAGLLVLTLPVSAGATSIVFEGSGADAASIQPAVDVFRAALGNPNNGNNPGPLFTGRREINWDGGGQATTISPTPFDGFLNTRGAQFTTLAPGTGFVQAPPSGLATTFNNPTYSNFSTFSSPRLFTPMGSTLTNVGFFIPGTNGGTAATVTGFGAVFVDVDSSANASLSFVNAGGVSQGSFPVPAANNGLSFLGVIFTDQLISQVQLLSGNVPLGGANDGGAIDIVVMDDFLYSEPAVVPEPTTLLLLGTTMAGLGFTARWRRRRQN